MCIIEFSFCCTDVSDVLSLGCRSVGDFKTKQNIVGRLWDFFFPNGGYFFRERYHCGPLVGK